MQWIRWTMMAALGLAPAICGAQEAAPGGQPNAAISRHNSDEPIFGRREKGSYLGVSAQPASGVLRKQLGLQPGMGLVVKLVMPDSPAAAAGLQPDDLLEKLNDQSLVNVEQLAVLVRACRPGDEIKLGVIREGKRISLTAKLAERELEPLSDVGDEDEMPGWRPLPKVRFHMFPERVPTTAPAEQNMPSSISLLSGDRMFSITFEANGQKKFVVEDKQGTTIFEGAIDTQAERDAVPDALKPRLKSLLEAKSHMSRKAEQQ